MGTTRVRRITTYTYEDDDHGVFPVEFEPYDSSEVEIRVKGNRAVLGYIVHDGDAQDCNPMKSDCNGTLYTTGHDTITDNASACYSELGLDSEGYPDLDQFDDQAPENAILTLANDDLKAHGPLGAKATSVEWTGHRSSWRMWANDQCYDITVVYPQGGTRTVAAHTEQEWVEGTGIVTHLVFRGRTLRLPRITDDDRKALWIADQQKDGPSYNILIDYTYYSSVGPSYYSPEERATPENILAARHIDGVWVPDKDCLDDIKATGETEEERWVRAYELCKGILEEYTKWCNGEVYGLCVQTYERTDADAPWQDAEFETGYYDRNGHHRFTANHVSVWGMIGDDWATESMKEEFKNIADDWLKEDTHVDA